MNSCSVSFKSLVSKVLVSVAVTLNVSSQKLYNYKLLPSEPKFCVDFLNMKLKYRFFGSSNVSNSIPSKEIQLHATIGFSDINAKYACLCNM